MKQLEERFVAWAQTRQDIRAALVIGSRARTEHPADEWSDLDIVFFTTKPELYLSNADWLENIEKPLLTFVQETPTGGQRERRVLFEGGLDVDFTIVNNAEAKLLLRFLRLRKWFPKLPHLFPKRKAQKMLQEIADFVGIIRRGMRVLLDKDGVVAFMPLVSDSSLSRPPLKPTQSEFMALVNEFWYLAVLMTKKLRRGALWTAIRINDCSMKLLLLQMMEWHARAMNGWDYDTWHNGNFLEEWADPRALNALPDIFAHYNKDDMSSALRETMKMFRWLAIETAEQLGFPSPIDADRRTTELIEVYLSQKAEVS
jgi:aminoglycoside 6-adenylyltransferase